MIVPTAPVAPTTATSLMDRELLRTAARAGSCPRPELERAVQRAHGVRDPSPRTTQEILIGEVEIISMLMPSSPSVGEDLGGDAGMRLHARADDRDLAHRLVGLTTADAELADERLERVARGAQVVARDGERHVGARALGHRLVLDDHVDVDVGLGQRGRRSGRRCRACRARPSA